MNITALALLVCLSIVVGSATGIVTQWESTPEDGSDVSVESQDQGGSRGDVFGILDQFDPYPVPDFNFSLQLKEITAEGSTKGVVVKGISGLKLTKLSVKLVDGKVAVDLSLPSLSVVGEYKVTGNIDASGFKLPLQGEGQLNGGFEGLDLQTSIELGISDEGQILLDDFSLVWNMTDIQVQLEGLYGGTNLGKIINNLLKDFLPRLVLKTYHTKITSEIISLVKEKGGPFLLSLHKDHGKPDTLRLLPVTRDIDGDVRDVVQNDEVNEDEVNDDEVNDDEVRDDLVLCKVFPARLPCVPLRYRAGLQEYADGGSELSRKDKDGVERAEDTISQPASGGALQFKPVGRPRFFPHGSLFAEDTYSNELAVDGVQQLLSTFGLSVEDPSAFGIKPVGEPRFSPHGSLASISDATEHGGDDVAEQLLSLFGVSVKHVKHVKHSITGSGEPEPDVDKQIMRSILGDALRVRLSDETKFYRPGTLVED